MHVINFGIFLLGILAGAAATLWFRSRKLHAIEDEVLKTASAAVQTETQAFAARLKILLGI